MDALSLISQPASLNIKTAENTYAEGLKKRIPVEVRQKETPQTYADIPNIKKIEEKAQEFESVFLSEMLRPMFEGIDVDPLFGGGKGEEIFNGMLIQEYGKKIAQTGSIGLADFVKKELIRIQQETSHDKS